MNTFLRAMRREERLTLSSLRALEGEGERGEREGGRGRGGGGERDG